MVRAAGLVAAVAGRVAAARTRKLRRLITARAHRFIVCPFLRRWNLGLVMRPHGRPALSDCRANGPSRSRACPLANPFPLGKSVTEPVPRLAEPSADLTMKPAGDRRNRPLSGCY